MKKIIQKFIYLKGQKLERNWNFVHKIIRLFINEMYVNVFTAFYRVLLSISELGIVKWTS